MLVGEPAESEATATGPAGRRQDRELFGGSAEADRRGRDFTGPIPAPPRS